MSSRRLLVAIAAMLALTACAGSADKDFDRHRLSNIGESAADPGVYVFESKISPKYPADSAAAELMRLEWLDDWMKQRAYCSEGHEVLERRAFRSDEPNPYRSDLRYSVKCAEPE